MYDNSIPQLPQMFQNTCYVQKIWYTLETMSQLHLAKIKCAETGEIRWTRKNKKQVERKLEFKKYSPKLRKVVTFKEVKK